MMATPSEIFLDPEKHGYTECDHCNGYGSSLKERPSRCTRCDGLGLIKKKDDGVLKEITNG